jgi:hypothetical protein
LIRQEGNGDTQHEILVDEVSPGYFVFSPGNLLDVPEQHFAHLSMKLSSWLKANPQIRIRETLSLSDRSGQAVILHVWFDIVHVVPPPPPQPPQ